MAKKIKEISLDLNQFVLEGWERHYCPLNIKALRPGLELGHSFPRVDVVKKGKIYLLVFGRDWNPPKEDNYGGHSRSRLALEDRFLLECDLFDNHRFEPSEHSKEIIYRPVVEMTPKISSININCQLKITLSYLPDKVREKFIRENDLVIRDDGVLMTRYDFENPLPF